MPTVISVEHLSKAYRLGQIGTGTLTYDMKLWWAKVRGKPNPLLRIGESDHGNRDGETIWALKDVSFTVEQGEVLGIIGRNGAGKSTLLKILSRVTAPTSGRIRVKGRIASLLEVGTGFHPELTGRENIYLNGAILGMKRDEITRKFAEIVDFSGVEKFIDTPVKRYSSGMYVRLAFAVAAHLEPEILVVDEVLAVGDAEFQKKCLGKMGEVAQGGRTVLFVSHQLDMIRALCPTTILLRLGEILAFAHSEDVIGNYLKIHQPVLQGATVSTQEDFEMPIQVIKARISNTNGETKQLFDVFESICIEIDYLIQKPITGAIVCFEIKYKETVLFWSFDTDTNEDMIFDPRRTGLFRSRIKLPCPFLRAGQYSLSFYTGIANSERIQSLNDVISFEIKLMSRGATFLSYAEKRPGIIAANFHWETERIS